MSEEEYHLELIDRIHEELPSLTQNELLNIYQYILNPENFQIIDCNDYVKMKIEKYAELYEKYPEEFI